MKQVWKNIENTHPKTFFFYLGVNKNVCVWKGKENFHCKHCLFRLKDRLLTLSPTRPTPRSRCGPIRRAPWPPTITLISCTTPPRLWPAMTPHTTPTRTLTRRRVQSGTILSIQPPEAGSSTNTILRLRRTVTGTVFTSSRAV